MTAGERLLQLAGAGGTAAALLLIIGSGATAGQALTEYSGLESATAAEHLLHERQQEQPVAGGGGSSIPPPSAQPPIIAQPATPLPVLGAPGAVIPPPSPPGVGAATDKESLSVQQVGAGEAATNEPIGEPIGEPAQNLRFAIEEPPPIITAHFDLDQLLAEADAIEARLRQQREAESIALILAISEAVA